jgi:hypothetical protein
MKPLLALLSVLVGSSALAQPYTISNPWSGVTGDRANLAAFAFRADAGQYPDSIAPLGSLGPTLAIQSLTLVRPNDATTPTFGGAAGQITDASTPVYVDIYATFGGGVFGGYVGSSTTGVAWNETAADQPYTFEFTGVTLSSSAKYFFVFSEDSLEGDIAQFRLKVNTAGADTTPGPGRGYLVGDTAQVVLPNLTLQDWGVNYTVAVPEPSTFAVFGLGAVALLARRRRA